jgi:hypothetical protein
MDNVQYVDSSIAQTIADAGKAKGWVTGLFRKKTN